LTTALTVAVLPPQELVITAVPVWVVEQSLFVLQPVGQFCEIGIVELLEIEHELLEQVSQWQSLVFSIPQSMLLVQPVGQLPPVIILPPG